MKQDPVLAQLLTEKSECLVLEQILRRGPEKEGLQLKIRELDLVIQRLKTQNRKMKRLVPKKTVKSVGRNERPNLRRMRQTR